MSEQLTKVYVDLPNHWATGGESMWAAAVGQDQYELRNSPFYAYDLNWGDVVLATPENENEKPRVRHVVSRSGHSTLRVVFFHDKVSKAEALSRVESLKPMDVTFEGWNEFYFSLDVATGSSPDAVRDVLDQWLAEGVAEYETCEARLPGSFDAAPAGDD